MYEVTVDLGLKTGLDKNLKLEETRLRVDKDKPKGWFKGNWKGDYSKLLWATLTYSGLL